VVAPRDSRLPGGGGYTIGPLYDVVPGKAGQVDNLITDAARHGQWTQYFNGIDVTVDLRAAGLTVSGGTSSGQSVADNCNVRRRLPELSTATTGTSAFGAGLATSTIGPTSPYCHVASTWLTQLRGLAAYDVPKAGFQASVTFQSKPGPMLAANYVMSNDEIAPQLGRSLSGNAPNVTVNLITPGTMYGSRINHVDLRVTKLLSFGRSKVTFAAEVYNALDSRVPLAYNATFAPGIAWPQPMMTLTPRFVKLTGEVRF